MTCYSPYQPYFGDIHNHCGISYGHGSLEDALANARESLDFVSITGHAHWPDMPAPNEQIQHLIDFHVQGFDKLKKLWPSMLKTLKQANEEGRFVVFPAFEIHLSATGDRNILYKDLAGEILYPNDLEDLHRQLRDLRSRGIDTLAQPHHIGYRKGTRGIDWGTFDPEFAPVVELISMHGCSETNDTPRPFLRVMGPSDWEGTIQYGWAGGIIFGVTGGTDHHSAHPGSYGHGKTGLWATDCTREAIWEALYHRRTYALTGDRIILEFSLNDAPMGSVVPPTPDRRIKVNVTGGAAIDYVDIVKNNRLFKRFSQCDFEDARPQNTIRTKLYLELGWGPRHETTQWDVEFGIRQGRILDVEPRFRGRQVVSPLDSQEHDSCYTARVVNVTDTTVTFSALSESNSNTSTQNTQGMCLDVELPVTGQVYAVINGRTWQWSVEDLLEGSRADLTRGLASPALRIHRAPHTHELFWSCRCEDQGDSDDYYYVRVRQSNDQWAWSSPIFVRSVPNLPHPQCPR